MNKQTGQKKREDAKQKPEFLDEANNAEIKEDDLDRVSGGGNATWGTFGGPSGGGS